MARRYLAEILDKDIDTLIMGCTHYPLLRSLLRKVVGEKVTLVNPAYETSQALRRLLRELDLENPGNDELGRQKYQFFASDGVERFNASHIPFCRSRSAIRNRYRLKTIKNDIQKRERNIRKGWKKTYSSASADCSI